MLIKLINLHQYTNLHVCKKNPNKLKLFVSMAKKIYSQNYLTWHIQYLYNTKKDYSTFAGPFIAVLYNYSNDELFLKAASLHWSI